MNHAPPQRRRPDNTSHRRWKSLTPKRVRIETLRSWGEDAQRCFRKLMLGFAVVRSTSRDAVFATPDLGLQGGRALALALSVALIGCTVPSTRTTPDPTPATTRPPTTTSAAAAPANSATTPSSPHATPDAAAASKATSPAEAPTPPPTLSHRGARVSASVGEPGGVVLLWTRVIPADDSPRLRDLAAKLQSRLGAITRRAAPGRPIDQRPEPERACPQAGCKGTAVSALLVHRDQGCAAVLLLGPPGRTPVRLIPWAGRVGLKEPTAAFRSPPESQLIIEDFATCDGLIDALATREAEIEANIKALVRP